MTISQMTIKISKRDYARGGGGPRGIVPRAHFFRLSFSAYFPQSLVSNCHHVPNPLPLLWYIKVKI